MTLEVWSVPDVKLAGITSGPSRRNCLARGEGSGVSRSCLAIAVRAAMSPDVAAQKF